MKTAFIAVLLLGIVLTLGCTAQTGTGGNASNTGNNPTGEQPLVNYTPPTGTPTLELISPTDGSVIHSSAVGIKVAVTNFRLVSIASSLENVHNEGHIDYFLDDQVQKSPFTSTSFTQVSSGAHTIRAELRNNDDTPLYPPIVVTATVTVSP